MALANNPQLRALQIARGETNATAGKSISPSPRPTFTTTYWTWKGKNYFSIADLQRAQEDYRLAEESKKEAQKTQLTREYQTAYNEAKTANEARYKEILGGYDTLLGDVSSKYGTRYNTMLSDLKGYGEAEIAEIASKYRQSRASATQGLISSGLYSTTVAPSVLGQVDKAEAQAIALAREGLTKLKLGMTTQMSKEEIDAITDLTTGKFGVMERRTDEYPSESLYVQLLNQLGNTG